MTYSVFFDVLPKKGFSDAYFGMASGLKPLVEKNPGFISVERFENLGRSGWYLSHSQWTDEHALSSWRCQYDHHGAQVCGRNLVLEDYRLRVGRLMSTNRILNKNAVIALVGDFSEAQDFVNRAQISMNALPRLFRGIINPSRGIALIDAEIEDSDLVDFVISEKSTNVGTYEVQRDYGMFDRAQAPSVFA
jgi:heme-degrading monooxygenase HmoA